VVVSTLPKNLSPKNRRTLSEVDDPPGADGALEQGQRLATAAIGHQERMAALGIQVTAAEAVRQVQSQVPFTMATARSAAPAAAQSMSFAEAESVAIAARVAMAANARLSLPEAVRRVMTAQQARLAGGRTGGIEASDPLELAHQAIAYQAKLAKMGVAVSAAAAVREVLDGAAAALG
jgi:hypothetical protein